MTAQATSQSTVGHSTLAGVLWPMQAGSSGLVRNGMLAVLGSLLLIAAAKVQVPFWPVPMTMQTFAVLVIGMTFGPRLGAATVLLYLVQGAVGLPVFAGTPAKGIGIAYMVGPTGGYLIGFVAAAYLAGRLAMRGWDRKPLLTALAMVLGMAVIYVLGVAWLSTLIGVAKALQFGVVPFLLADGLKIVLAMVLLPLAWRGMVRVSGDGHE